MNNKKTLLILCAALVLLLAGAGALYTGLSGQVDVGGGVAEGAGQAQTQPQATPSADGEEEPQQAKAPDFTVLNDDGNEVSLAGLAGKPVILNFWASWCGPCKSEMPAFQTLWEEYGDRVHFMMIDLTDGARETVDSARAFIGRTGYTFPVYYDTTGEAAIAYGVSAIPTTYILDAEGNALAYARSALDEATLRQAIQTYCLPENEK